MSKTPGSSDEGEDIVVDIEAPPAGPAEFEDPDDREAAAESGPTDLAAAEASVPEPGPDAPAESAPESAPVEAAPDAPRSRVRLVAFASGRGGTGRSLLAANVAVYLAQAAKKVVAIDADPAGGPLHQLLGAPRPPR